MNRKIVKSLVVSLTLLMSFISHAGLIKDSGVIIGIDGIVFGGVTYNVAFDNRACIDIFDGCDSTDDFFFNDQTTAENASAALGAAMFNALVADSFVNNRISVDSILSCFSNQCNLMTPFRDTQAGLFGIDIISANLQEGNPITESSWGLGNNLGVFAGDNWNASGTAERVWVVWEEAQSINPVPVPASLSLIALALLGLGLRRRVR